MSDAHPSISHNPSLQVITTVSVPTSDSTWATHLSEANAVGVEQQKHGL